LQRASSKGSLRGSLSDNRQDRRSSEHPSSPRRDFAGIAAVEGREITSPATTGKKGIEGGAGSKPGSFLTLQAAGSIAGSSLLGKLLTTVDEELLIRYPVKVAKMLLRAKNKLKKTVAK
jgi:hypothetical protein